MTYLVIQYANMHDSRQPGYGHAYGAHADNTSPWSALVCEPSFSYTGVMIPVYEKWIEAETGTAAINKYRQWKTGEVKL